MRKALLIGIDDYPLDNKLSGCVNDVSSLAPLLERNGNGDILFDVKKMLNVQSSIEAMEAIKQLFAGDEEMVLFYFSGHGYDSKYGTELVFPNNITDRSIYNGIKLNDILNLAKESRVKNKVFILDSCFAGAMGDISVESSDSILFPGVTILSACRKDQTSAEINNRGIFTRRLCQALSGSAAAVDGTITLGSIYTYIDSMFGSWEQRPVFKTNVSQFVAFRKVRPRVPLVIIRKITSYFKEINDTYKLDPSYEETNSPKYSDRYKNITPIASPEHIEILKQLQKLESIGLVEPVNEDHMYWAVMNSGACKLTDLGKHYWNLVNANRI